MFLEELLIKKKDGTLESYDREKVLAAVNKSAERARGDAGPFAGHLSNNEEGIFLALLEKDLMLRTNNVIETKYLHSLVERCLTEAAADVADAYKNYHSFRMHQAKSWETIYGKSTMLFSDATDNEALSLKQQNANSDSTLSSTKKCFLADYTAEEMYHEFFLTKSEKQAGKDGFIYIHNRNARMVYALNCCLFRVGYVMEHGGEINGVPYNRPTTLAKAFDVMGDLILINASQQYGGFTVPRVDSILVPYAQMSEKHYYEKYFNQYILLGVNPQSAHEAALEAAKKDVIGDFYDGFQGIEIKLNTVASSRGDYPFVTFTFGLETSEWGKIASVACLETRKKGQGKKGKKKPVLFPKLVFLYDENLHGPGKELEDVFEAGIACSAETMYPDWLSLTGKGYVPSMYQKYGVDGVISPMGCRAFLSPWYERGGMEPADENDKPVFEGRFNVGAISLNLPMILAKAQKENTDFYEELDHYLNLIRNIHKRTYEYLGNMKASVNPMAFCYGGLCGGHLAPSDRIKPLLKSATASFGITALNELQQQYNRHSLYEDGAFALEVMEYINKKVAAFKKEDGHLYAIYGTPAESLCGTQVKQYRAMFGVVEGVSDREYVSNSFHCHVTEKISPIQKQDSEYRFWDLCNGGKIQYCRYNLGYNVGAIRTLIRRAMDMGFYEGVNLALDFCDDCGHKQVEMGLRCPVCGSYHITQIDRMNGYLGITRVGRNTVTETDSQGNTIVRITSRFNPAKVSEIQERVSM